MALPRKRLQVFMGIDISPRGEDGNAKPFFIEDCTGAFQYTLRTPGNARKEIRQKSLCLKSDQIVSAVTVMVR